jgi:hypothetical protein
LRDFPAAGAGAQHLNVRGRRLGPSSSAVTLAADLAPAVDATFRWLLLGSNANQPLTPICKAVQPNGASEDRPLGVPPASAADENVKMIATIPAGPPTHCATWVINIGQCVDLRQSRSEYVLGCNRSMKAERRPPFAGSNASTRRDHRRHGLACPALPDRIWPKIDLATGIGQTPRHKDLARRTFGKSDGRSGGGKPCGRLLSWLFSGASP